MGKCETIIKEVRFVFEDELTQTYILTNALGDCPSGVQGWHHKTFPKSMSAVDIMNSLDKDSYLLWPLKAPN
jgi:hypothetical protein